MTWLEIAENPEAVSTLFDTPPSLQGVEVFAVKIDRDGPTVELKIALREYPKAPPARWQMQGADTVVMTLQLMAVAHIEIQGWSTTNRADIEIARSSEAHLQMVAAAGSFKMLARFGFLRIVGLSAYNVTGGPHPR
jgi:hypothetical protein